MSLYAFPWLLALVLAAGCTRDNKQFCCTSAEDCSAAGVDDSQRECNAGLACVAHSCVVPTCASSGCAAAAPICDIHTDVCSACTSSDDCSRFPDTSVCDAVGGACVGCVASADCGPAAPICDAQACRGCKLDSECASGACGDDGACIPESTAVYVAGTGGTTPPCSQSQPCKDPKFATQQLNSTRQHLVFAPGIYELGSNYTWLISPATTTAPSVTIHGGGAVLHTATADGFLTLAIPTLMRDVEITNLDFFAIRVQSTATVENTKLNGGAAGLLTNGSATLHNVAITSTGCGIQLEGGALKIDGATVTGGTNGICAFGPTVVNILNLLVFGTSDTGLDLPQATGMIAFSTITNTGTSGSAATAVRCTFSSLTVTSSIAWTPSILRPVIDSCTVSNSIVGPTSVTGGTNVDPLFVNPGASNFHINGGSPAVDGANTGPTTDFEGGHRPTGARFDLGADEAP